MCINRLGPEKTGVLVLWEETLPVSCGPLGHLAEAGSHLWIELRDLCSKILGSSCRKTGGILHRSSPVLQVSIQVTTGLKKKS